MKKFRILALIMTCAILLSSIMIPVSAASTTPAAKDTMGEKITIDGKDSEACWEDALTFKFELAVNTPLSGASDHQNTKVEPQTYLKVCHDANYLYIYVESTNKEAFTVGTSYLDIWLLPGTTAAAIKSNTIKDSSFTRLSLNWSNAATGTTEDQTEKSLYDIIRPDLPSGEGGYLLGNKSVIQTFNFKKDSDNDTWAYMKSDLAKNITLALNVERTGNEITEKAYEIKIPLASNQKSGADFQIALREKTGKYQGEDATDGGYIVANRTYAGGLWDYLIGNQLHLEVSKTAPVLVGFQSRTNPTDNTKYDVRFVSVVDAYTGFTLEDSKLGYLFNNGERDSVQTCTKVYTELKAGNDTIKASDFGGKYFFCFTITGLDPDQTYDLNVKCFTQKDAESAKEFCANAVDVQITYDKENSKADFTY